LKNGWIRRVFTGSFVLLAIVFLPGCGDDDDDGAVVPVTHSISGQVTLDNAGLTGVTMALTGASTDNAITDASGNYTFDNLANGNYTVTPSLTGFTFSPTDNTPIVSGADITGVNFTATATTVVSVVITKIAALDNAQETAAGNPSESTGMGGGILTVDTATRKASGFVVSTGVPGTEAHIHSAARAAQGGIIVTLVGGPDIWVVPDNTTLSETNVTAFQAGNLYYNILSTEFDLGEIRGQLDFTPTALKLASLDNTQETTGSTSSGLGGGILGLDNATSKVRGFVVSTGVDNVTVAHVHTEARGVQGDITVPLFGGPDFWFVQDNAAALTPDNVAAFQAGNMYFNIHNDVYTDGAIRGQLDLTPTEQKLASLDNTQETTGSTSTGVGGGVLGIDNATGQVRGFVVSTGVDNGTEAHVHTGARGIEGTITVPLVGGPDLWFVPDNAAALTAPEVAAFQAGDMYFNIHNDVYTDGAIRGQLDFP
jgi:hypothetical protein